MKKPNKKTLVYAILGLLIFGVAGGYVGGKYILRLRVNSWKEQGIAASKAGDHARAADLLVRYLQRRGGDETALEYYIKSRELAELPNGRHLSETIAALKQFITLQPEDLDARLHLLKLYAKVEQRPEAIEMADSILNVVSKKKPKERTPQEQQVMLAVFPIKTEVLEKMGNYRDMLQTAQTWAEMAPHELQPHLNRFKARKEISEQLTPGRPLTDVVADAQKLLAANPDNPRFELLMGWAYGLAGDNANARDWLTKTGNRKDLPTEVGLALVSAYDDLGLSAAALAELEKLAAQPNASTEIRNTLGKRLWESGRWSDSVAALSHIDPQNSQADPTLVALKAFSLSRADKKAESDACRAALSSRTTSAAARAWTLILNHVIDRAKVDDKQVVSECRSAIAGDRSNVYLQYYFAEACARLGETDLAILAWRNVVLSDPTWLGPGINLVDALMQKGQEQEAMWTASIIARHNRTQAAAAITLARAWSAGIENSNIAQSEALLKLVTEVQSQLPGEEQTLFIQVKLLSQKGDKEAATKAIRKVLARTVPPPSEPLLLGLAALSKRDGLQLEDELVAMSEHIYGITPALASRRALDRLSTGDAAGGLRKFDELAKQSNKATELPWQLERARYLDISGSPDARVAWIALADTHPTDMNVQRAAISSRSTLHDWDFQNRTIDRLKSIAGDDGLFWRLAQARLYVEGARGSEDYEKGALLLTRLVKEHPSPEAHILLGRALARLNRLDGAIEHFSEASRLDPSSVPVTLELAGLLQARGDFEQVNRELDRIAPQLRSAPERHQAAVLYARQGNNDKAVQLLEGDKAKGEAQQEDLVLAVLYRQQRQFDKAEAVVRKLLEKPEVDTIQFAAALYGARGKRAEAEQALAKLDTIKLEPGVKELAWGGYYAQVNDLPHALEKFQQAVRSAPASPLARRAVATTQLMMGKPTDCTTTINEAAAAIPTDKGFAEITKQSALFLVAANDPEFKGIAHSIIKDPSSAQSTFELVKILNAARQDPNPDNEKLASQLEQYGERHPESLHGQLQLMQVYVNMGRLNEALTAGQRAMRTFGASAEPAKVTVTVAAASHRWSEMRAAAEIWKKRTVDNPTAADLAIAQSMMSQGQYQDAIVQLQPYLPAAKAAPDKNMEMLGSYCSASIHIGNAKEASDLLWPLVQNNPAWRPKWVALALETDDETAGQWLDRLAGIVSSDQVFDSLLLAEGYEQLAARTKDAALGAKANQAYEKLGADSNVNPVSLVAVGARAERKNDTKTAEAFYRRALKLEGQMPIAQNNLAMIVANRGGDLNEAQDLASAAVKTRPRIATFRDTQAFVHATARNYRAAADSERVAVSLEPDQVIWRVRHAYYLLKSGDFPQASAAIRALDGAHLDVRKAPPEIQGELKRQLDEVREAIRTGGAPRRVAAR